MNAETNPDPFDDLVGIDGDVYAGTIDEAISAAHGIDAPEPEERQVHIARCAECAMSVRFQHTSGSGFTLADSSDISFGVGEHGRPVCPNGHGEMGIADETLPAADAFAAAQAQLDADEPTQRTLPGIVPPFNFQGAYLELEAQAVEVQRLLKIYEADAKAAKDSKKTWDDADALFTKMAIEFRRRRSEKVDAAQESTDRVEPEPRLVKCKWDEKNPDAPCPLCSDTTAPSVVDRLVGIKLAPTDAEAHIDDAQKLLFGLDVELTVEALENIDTFVKDADVKEWTAEERAAVIAWAEGQLDRINGVATTSDVPERPKVLGKPHIPSRCSVDEQQTCSVCEKVLPQIGDLSGNYQTTDFVGIDCTGQGPNRYPEKGKKKPAKKAKGAK